MPPNLQQLETNKDMPRKTTFTCCPQCGYSKAKAAASDSKFGGSKFSKRIASITASVTGVKLRDLTGKPRDEKFSQARVAAMTAVREISTNEAGKITASWEQCGDAIERDKSSAYRLFRTWKDDPVVKKNAAAIVEAYEGGSK